VATCSTPEEVDKLLDQRMMMLLRRLFSERASAPCPLLVRSLGLLLLGHHPLTAWVRSQTVVYCQSPRWCPWFARRASTQERCARGLHPTKPTFCTSAVLARGERGVVVVLTT